MIKKKTAIGIIGSLKGINTILIQEGIPFERISKPKKINLLDFPVLLIDNIKSKEFLPLIRSYLSNGGFIIMSSRAWKIYFDGKIQNSKVKYLEPENNDLFPNIGLLDLYNTIYIPLDSSFNAVDKNLKIYEKKIGLGRLVLYPFNLFLIMNDFNILRKRFYDNRSELPSELVAKVSKNKIRKIIFFCIVYLYNLKNIPLLSLWYYPKKNNSLFIFRVDTDFCSLNNAKQLYNLCLNYNIPGTWFLDTGNEKMLKEFYKNMKNQELGLHCNVHKVYNNLNLNLINIQNGLKKLHYAGIKVKGFASPFGDWNPSLGESINSFEYSSEFSLDYDNFPFFPYIDDQISNVLQIPIHPIGISRLNRSHYSKNEMFKYYLNLFKKKLINNEPIIIYFHPNNKHFVILEKIFQWVNNNNIMKVSMLDFSTWWKKRSNYNINYSYLTDSHSLINENNNSEDVYLRINYKNKYAIAKSCSKIDLSKLVWSKQLTYNYPKDLSKIRKFYWRDFLHNYESKKARNQF